jgi:kynurenine formamidase/ribonuclease HI
MKIIDISLPVADGMAVYPGTAPTKIQQVKSGSGQSILSQIQMTSHAGTHVDAPFHAVADGLFYGSARVVDLSECERAVEVNDLKAKNIRRGERILLKTANSRRGLKKFYDDYIYLSAEGAAFLAEAGVKLVGIDALSIKKRGDEDNTSHTALLAKGIPIVEGLNLANVSEGEYLLAAFPLALQTDGAPARAVLIAEAEPEGTLISEAKLFTDGGSRGNPGESAIAHVICKMDDSVVEKTGKYIGIATNNQAEYKALLAGLERVIRLGIKKLTVYMDSELIVKQLKGEYKIKNPELTPLYRQIKKLSASFGSIAFVHVPRALNSVADGEVNRILDEQKRSSKT